jgi:hypothetical protein
MAAGDGNETGETGDTGTGTGAAGGTGGEGTETRIPKARFDTVIRERNEARGELEAARARIAELEGAQTSAVEAVRTTMAAQLNTANTALADAQTRAQGLEGRVSELETARAEDMALVGLGLSVGEDGKLDPEGRRVARSLYDGVPEADRPEGGFAAWLGNLGDGEGKTAVPAGLAAYLPQDEPEGTRRRRPRANLGVRPELPNGGGASLQAIREAKAHGQQTGDWSRFRKLMGAKVESSTSN